MAASTITRITPQGVHGVDINGEKFALFHAQIKDVIPTPMGSALVLEDGSKIKMLMGHNRLGELLLAGRKLHTGI